VLFIDNIVAILSDHDVFFWLGMCTKLPGGDRVVAHFGVRVSVCWLVLFFVLCVCVQFAGIDFSVLPAFFLLSQSQSALVALSADDVPPRFAAAPPPGVTPRAQPDRRASSLSRHHAPAATAAARSPTLGFVAASACGLREAVRGPRVLSENAKANK
jgi:hypothetical protein